MRTESGYLLVLTYEALYFLYKKDGRYDTFKDGSQVPEKVYGIPFREHSTPPPCSPRYRGINRRPLNALSYKTAEWICSTGTPVKANDATEYLDAVELRTGLEDGLVTSLDDILTAWSLLEKGKPEVMTESGKNLSMDDAWDQVEASRSCRELIWTREYNDPCPVPPYSRFLGYDAVYMYTDYFSCIKDALFFPVWHGSDSEGVLLREHYDRLNANGLFDTYDLALAYLKHYQTFEWAEIGESTIIEVYSVTPPGGTARCNEE